MTSEQLGDIATIFLAFRDQLKIYHWQTTHYSRHMAADQLVTDVTLQMDRFMETIQGSRHQRMKISSENKTIVFKNETDSGIITILKAFKKWLETDLSHIIEADRDLSNIRDEIVGSVNKSLYLFTLG